MRVAVTQGTLRIPPTYFATQHAQLLADRHDFTTFVLVADVRDDAVTVPVRDVVPGRRLPFRRREVVMPAFMPALTRDVVRWQPDVIHQHFATWSVPAVRAAVRARTPLVVTLHGADVFTALRPPSGAMHRWHQHNVRRAGAQADRLLAVSHYLAGRAVAAGLPASRVEVHYQGVDTDYFRPDDADAQITAEEPVVAFVGALAAHKGVPDLLEASQRLARTAPHRLVLVGDGPLRGVAEEAAREHAHIEVRGSLPREEVRRVLRAAHCLVLPTRERNGAREAAGLVLLEAQACGTPVVTYHSGGAPEMVQEDVTGLVAADGDVRALTAALSDMLALPAAAHAAMRCAAREYVVENRSLRASAAELEQHYEAVVGR